MARAGIAAAGPAVVRHPVAGYPAGRYAGALPVSGAFVAAAPGVEAGRWPGGWLAVAARAVVGGVPPALVVIAMAAAAAATRMAYRPVPAVLSARVAPVPAAPAPVAGPFRVLWILRPHVPGGQNNDDEDNDDNYRQANHELSHRTIQSGMASQCGASETHAAIDAGLTSSAGTLIYPRLIA